MKILQISQKPPYPTVDGGCVAMADIAKLVALRDYSISLFTLFSKKHPYIKEAFPEGLYKEVFAHQVNSEPTTLGAIKSLLNGKNYITERFRDSAVERSLISVLDKEHFDIIILESTYTGLFIDLIRKHSKAKIVLRSHNIEHELWKKRHLGLSFLKKMLMRNWVDRFEMEEKKLWKDVDAVLSINQEEGIEIQKHSKAQVEYFPISVEVHGNARMPSSNFYFLGAMDWEPNLEALDWFCREVWPGFIEQNPNALFHLAGKGLLHSDYKNLKGIVNHGFVESTSKFLSDKGILINPLRTGQGIRVKALEAIASGKAIISTVKGMEGLPFMAGEHYLQAESAAEFISQMEYVQANPHLLQEMVQKAQQTAAHHFSPEALGRKLSGTFHDILKLKGV